MKIWLISIFEQTPVDGVFSTRFIAIAEEALKRGHEVTFFASTFKHNTKKRRYRTTTEIEFSERYKLVFVKSKPYKRNVSINRLYSHYKFAYELVKNLNNHEDPDVILLAFPPIHLAKMVSEWGADKQVPVVIDIIDPWPEVFVKILPSSLRFIAKSLFFLSRKGVKLALKGAAAVTAISNQYLNWAAGLTSSSLNRYCFFPAADLEAIRECRKSLQNGNRNVQERECLNIIYGGSFASSYDIPCILEAAEILEKAVGRQVCFKIAGAGPQEGLIREYQTNHTNLSLLGRLTKEDLLCHYLDCDLGLTQHVSGATQSVTYKLFDLLANGLPILNSLESEMRDIIVENKVGMHNAPGDARQLADNILTFLNAPDLLQQYKNNALKLAADKGDSRVVYGGMVDLLEKVAEDSSESRDRS